MRHSSQLIDFPYAEPIKGDEESSVYYWWWMYLKRATVPINPDFGDVSGDDFWEWWSSPAPIQDERKPARQDKHKWRSVYLFANPEKQWTFTRVKKPLPENAYTDPTVLILTVPLDEPDAYLIDRFKAYLDTMRERLPGWESTWDEERQELVWPDRRGVRAARSSQAKYPVIGQPNVKALKKTLLAYDMKIAGGMTLWQIGYALDDSYDTSCVADRNTLSVIASRYIKKAKAMINNAAAGRFPDVK